MNGEVDPRVLAEAKRLHAAAKAHRLAMLPPGARFPADWERAVEAAFPAVWPPYRLAVPAGWMDLVLAFSDHLAAVAPGAYVDDSKEKYGTMRLSLTGEVTDAALDLVDIYDELSAHTCQDCGEPGVLRQDRGWWATLCDVHDEKRDPQ